MSAWGIDEFLFFNKLHIVNEYEFSPFILLGSFFNFHKL